MTSVTKTLISHKMVQTLTKKEFAKIKRFVQKRHPGAYTIKRSDGSYAVVDGQGLSVVSPELYLPPAKTVAAAWELAKYTHWFQGMIKKSNNAFDESKVYSQKEWKE